MTCQTRIHAVIFDLFQTLIPVAPGSTLRALFCRAVGLPEDHYQADVKELYYRASIGSPGGVEACMRREAAKLGRPVDEDLLLEGVRHRKDRHLYGFHHIDPATVEFIRRLPGAGYRVGLLSNSDDETVSLYSGSPLSGLFEVEVFSHEVGMAKPDQRIFQHTAVLLNVPPQDCLFVGDGANREFEGARSAGMKTALLLRYANEGRREEWSGFVDYILDDLDDLAKSLGLTPDVSSPEQAHP